MWVEDRRRKIATLAVTGVGFFMVLLDITIVSVALPTVQQDLHSSLSGLSWVVDAYTLPFAALLLTFGHLGDRLGRKRLFVAGLIAFTAGSLICAAATAIGVLEVGRAIQGVGGAALSPASLALIATAFPQERERTRALGLWSAITGLALAAGPLVGGVLIQTTGSWRAVFLVNVPLGVLAVLLGVRMLPETHQRRSGGSFDLLGQALSILGLTPVVFALAEAQSRGWTSPVILGSFGGGLILLVGFVLRERQAHSPMLPLALFRDRMFSTSAVATFGVGFALTSNTFFVSQLFQDVQHVSALESGLRTLPTTAGIALTAPLAGRLAGRFGYRVPVTLGTTLAAVGIALLTRLDADTPYRDIWWTLALVGVGFGLTLSPLVAAVLSATPPAAAGVASGVNNVSRQLGGTIGVAALPSIVTIRLGNLLTDRLESAGVAADPARQLAQQIAARGAAAARPDTAPTAPVHGLNLARTVGEAFAAATHTAFAINGLVLILAAAISAALLRPHPNPPTPHNPAGSTPKTHHTNKERTP